MEEPEAREKIIKAIEAGRVGFSEAGQRYFDRAGVIAHNPDFTIVEATVNSFWGPWEEGGRGNKGGMEISWSTVSAGFGSLTLHFSKEGELKVDSEGMGKDFCKSVLAKLIDSMDDEQFKR